MNAIELMCGDLILVDGRPTRVYGIMERIGRVYDTMTNDISLKRCKPIPIAEEILQKNFPTPEEIVWWPLKDGSFRVEMQDDTHLIIGKYNYVHELQHALRLFGKDGEIKL